MKDLGQQGRGGQAPRVHGPRHWRRFNRGRKRFALTHAATIDILHVFNHFDLCGDDFPFPAHGGAHHVERMLTRVTDPVGLRQRLHPLLDRQVCQLRVPLTGGLFLPFIRDGFDR